MKKQSILMSLLGLFLTATSVLAQTSVTAGSQVTSEAAIVSGKAYLLQHQGNGTNTPWIEDKGTFYNCPNSAGNCNTASVWYLISNGDGTWKIRNAYTGKYWPKPVGNANLVGADAASAGDWALNFSSDIAAPTCNGYRLNRNTPNLVGWNSGSGSVTRVKIFEVTASTLSTAGTYSEFSGNDIVVSSTEAASLSEGQWYVLKNRGRNGYAYETSGSMKNQAAQPSGSATNEAKSLVRLLNAGDGKYYIQTGLSNFFGVIPHNSAVPTTALGTEPMTISKINNTDGHFYIQGASNSIVLDCQENGYSVVGWNTDVPTSTGGNNDWAFYPVTFEVSWIPAISEVYTINNTNTNRGALMYAPSQSTTFVWSSGKNSQTFDASSANCQWVICPTGTAGQYYLYNVGAGKFAIPATGGTYNGYNWIFSSSAIAVNLVSQSDGTYKIHTASGSIYASVSNNYTGPIINYNDIGGNFTITKVDNVDQSAAASAAVAKLVRNQTALTTYPQTTGWYAIQVKTASGNANAVGRYVYTAGSLYNGLYPLTFTGGADIQPSIADPTFLTYLECNAWDNNIWQLPDGRYLVCNGDNKFPTPSGTASAIIAGYDGGNYFKSSSNRFADPYTTNGNNFIGETTTFRTTWNVYPVSLSDAGLVAWQMLCDEAPASQGITCSRSDVSGFTTVYKNGYIFLPTGVTPESSEFSLDGATSVIVDASAHTVTFQYDPNLAIVEGGVEVAQGWQTAGRDGEVKLLRVTAAPFKDATGATLSISLKGGSESNISKLTLYEANSNSPEVLSTGAGAPTLTVVDEVNVSSSAATLSIGNFTSGTHYYWIGATVKSDATLGDIIDAAVTGITYTCNDNVTTLDLTSVGDPADRGAMVFNTHTYPFLPRDNGSRVYRIPAMVVADDGSIVVACDKRYDSYTDIGNGHVIDIVVRRSTDGGKTWSNPVTIAKGLGSSDNSKCGYGDPSLVKGKDGKIYCLFVAGNIGYFYGQQRIAMSTSTDNGVTWSSNENTPPVDLLETGALKNYNTVGDAGYGLYDYFVTSGRGLYIPEDDILMYLIPAQTMTSESAHTSNSQDYVFYSTDGGTSWYFSPSTMYAGGDEAKIILMNDGSLLGSIRQGNGRGFNTATYTKNNDGTLNFTFGTQYQNTQLHAGGYANNQDIFYYQRQTKTGKTDVIFHSMTTGQHANLKLYYSTDQGANWTEFLNIQTKGARYVTLEKSGTDANPGSLYVFYEDQSLNSAGGYTDYNHYPLNFLEITRDQLVALIPALDEKNVETKDVKIVYGTTGHTTYGTLSGDTWTSNVASGLAGLTLTKSDGTFDRYSSWNNHFNLAYKPQAANSASTLTLTAPEGYVITGYSLLAAKASSAAHTYTLTTSDGSVYTPAFASNENGYTTISMDGLKSKSETIEVTTTDVSKYIAIADFIVELEADTAIPGDVNNDSEVDGDDIATLVRVLLGVADPSEYDADAADVNRDGDISLGDLTALVNLLQP